MEFLSRLKLNISTEQVFDRIGTILLALVLALIVWLVAINRENPIIQDDYEAEIPITIRNLPEQFAVVGDLGKQEIEFEIKAPQDAWDRLTGSDFEAFIDLQGYVAGMHNVTIQVEVAEEGATILSNREMTRTLQIDEIITQTVPVFVDTQDPADGYRAEAPIVTPDSVEVSGPLQLVSQVQQATVLVNLQKAKQQVERTRMLDAVDSQGDKIADVTVKPALVTIVVPVVQIPGRKEVAVSPDLVGQPNSGYRLSSVVVEPNTVILQGASESLSQVPGSVSTEPIELTNASTALRESVALVLPPGVSARDGNIVSVTASITPIESSTRAQRTPVFESLGEGLQADITLDMVTVILSGPVPQLNVLREEDVRVVLDLSGLLSGTHSVTPGVELPENVSQVGLLPETVEVVISSLVPTPTPRIMLPPTPTKQAPTSSPLERP